MFRTLKSPAASLHWAQRAFYATGPLAALVLIAWLAGLTPGGEPMFACYLTLLLVAVGSACVAMLSACHLAIHDAFSAGFQTGQASVFPDDPDTVPAQRGRHRNRDDDPLLRLVD